MKLWVKKHFPDVKVQHISNGVDLEKFHPEVKAVDIELQHPIILTASRNQPNKRLDLAIEAVHKMGYGSLLMLSSGNTEPYAKKGLKC